MAQNWKAVPWTSSICRGRYVMHLLCSFSHYRSRAATKFEPKILYKDKIGQDHESLMLLKEIEKHLFEFGQYMHVPAGLISAVL